MSAHSSSLRRDLGTAASYATLIGILVGAGIFRVTGDAWSRTGSSVVLGYLVLAPITLATAVPYAVYLSTPLGRLPGAEYTHISRTFGDLRLAFFGAWLKVISYVGALAYLASAFADYLLHAVGGRGSSTVVSLAVLGFFYLVHVLGVRWFGRLQVGMCLLLGVSILVLVLPGLFAIEPSNYRPLFSHGAGGFLGSLPLLFFAFAGFESLAHTAAEVRDSTHRLPAVFLRGILVTTLIFVGMSVVSLGVLPSGRLASSAAPMSDAAALYLPGGLSWVVGLGALLALATSINATFLVPSRLWIMLVEDGLCPAWMGRISTRTRTPTLGLSLTLALSAGLIASGQIALALDIAVMALVLLYFLHSLSLLLLPRLNPQLYRSRSIRSSERGLRIASWIALLAMATILTVQVVTDLAQLRRTTLAQRLGEGHLTSIELILLWSALGAIVLGWRSRRRRGQSPAPGPAPTPTDSASAASDPFPPAGS